MSPYCYWFFTHGALSYLKAFTICPRLKCALSYGMQNPLMPWEMQFNS